MKHGFSCVQCGSKNSLELDHIIPFSLGGDTTEENLRTLCKNCNIKKSNKI
ncbi:MAG: HNH endonuclease [Candidatus Moranbacteria bacterium]|nr:HNH endonuclease [Candidatus Moranbacteria bacterium]